MTGVRLMGPDLAKNVFQVHGVDGERVWSRRLRRDGVGGFSPAAAMCGGHGGLCGGAPLGPCAGGDGPRGSADPGEGGEAVRPAAEHRCSDAAANAEAARAPGAASGAGQDRGVPGGVRGAPGTRPADAAPHVLDQRAARASGGVRHRRAGRRGGADPAIRARRSGGAGDGRVWPSRVCSKGSRRSSDRSRRWAGVVGGRKRRCRSPTLAGGAGDRSADGEHAGRHRRRCAKVRECALVRRLAGSGASGRGERRPRAVAIAALAA